MSVRVSTFTPVIAACSGLMYAGVPISISKAVKSVLSVSRWFVVALAMPKSITTGDGAPDSVVVTRMLEGLRSRWMMPFWWACWTAWQTWMKIPAAGWSAAHARRNRS